MQLQRLKRCSKRYFHLTEFPGARWSCWRNQKGEWPNWHILKQNQVAGKPNFTVDISHFLVFYEATTNFTQARVFQKRQGLQTHSSLYFMTSLT